MKRSSRTSTTSKQFKKEKTWKRILKRGLEFLVIELIGKALRK